MRNTQNDVPMFDTQPNRPLVFVAVLNGIILRPVSDVIGMLEHTGTGISLQDYTKVASAFERVTNSRAVQKIQKISRVIRKKH